MRIIVTGLITQHYTMGGVTWDYLQYLIGLKRLRHDVFYFEDSGEWPYNLDGGETGNDWVAKDCNRNIKYLNDILSRYGLEDRWAYHFPLTSTWYGLDDKKRKEIVRTADLLINVSGTLEKPENYRLVTRLVYVDSDPGFTQVKLKLQQHDFSDRINTHDVHFSFGECLPEYLKDEKYNWKPTRTPIVLSEWATKEPYKNVYTTIMNWTSYKPLQYDGKYFYQKDVEFIKFLDQSNYLKNINFEVALSSLQHANWQSDMHHIIADRSEEILNKNPVDLLSHFGWNIVDPADQCGDIDSYRRYILNSKAEWSVAKGGYVVSSPGWFSCRSACYLGAGRPVIVQDTGFGMVIPVGEGILVFNNPEESIEAVLEVEAHYALHAKRAKEIAREYFDSDKVLNQLIEKAYEN
jgi:hypothetical protein